MAKQFIVNGSWCEHLAVVHVTAESKEEALKVYEKTFSEDQRRGLDVNVFERKNGHDKFWDEHFCDGRSVYYGGYQYHC